ncbi:hypothetical protein PGTUg99_033930 [Puccinia graminis f. sp. tritici]|uniref:Uncharacterized protein n=1 Tax=Puccinia graminis f. sp. tritici TaxID=56615 RepID=A0A5B0R9B9_PUCGR|nr:hypothetical protein PGTUg99_033930 [Puccinia graminis f. sp. tritici]
MRTDSTNGASVPSPNPQDSRSPKRPRIDSTQDGHIELLQEEVCLLKEKITSAKNRFNHLKGIVEALRDEVAGLASLKVDMDQATRLIQAELTKAQLPELVHSLDQQMLIGTSRLSAIGTPGLTKAHPSQASLVELLHSINHQIILPNHCVDIAFGQRSGHHEYVAKGSSENPPTHFSQKWPQIIWDSIVHLNAAINKDQTNMNSTKFFDFFGKIREIIVILADIKSGTGNLITRLRKRPVHYLVAFLAGGVSGLMWVPTTKTIAPECLIVMVKYLAWCLSQLNQLSLNIVPHWP